jgi:putative hydrolase of the HAD superfamily
LPYRAVIFDLFGTLVDNDSFVGSFSEEFAAMLADMARVLDVDPWVFSRLWHETTPLRTTGALKTIEASLERIALNLGLPVSPERVQQAAELRMEYNRRKLSIPRPDAVETLSWLRASGYATALLSNCSPDVPFLWGQTALAPLLSTAIFSSSVGLAKPDPAIFRLACQRLGLAPGQCVYLADGEGGELAAASSLGMQAVLIRCSYQDPPDLRRSHVEPWSGTRLFWLRELPALLDGAFDPVAFEAV